jgi:hypothetical protein
VLLQHTQLQYDHWFELLGYDDPQMFRLAGDRGSVGRSAVAAVFDPAVPQRAGILGVAFCAVGHRGSDCRFDGRHLGTLAVPDVGGDRDGGAGQAPSARFVRFDLGTAVVKSTSTLIADMSQVPGFAQTSLVYIDADNEYGRTAWSACIDPEDYAPMWWEAFDLPYSGPVSGLPDSLLAHEFDSDFGSPERPRWVLLTATHVGWGDEYDGATGTRFLPRPGVTS